jgi:predicted membrane GTPase involved in stress response
LFTTFAQSPLLTHRTDFGGEVERILGMVDGVVLLVDAAEGPLPQTKFVLTKALKLGLKPIVLINKVDRSDARPQEVLNEVFDLFSALDADESQLDFPILHACGREGWAVGDGWAVGQVGKDLKPLFSVISSHIPPPRGSIDAPMQMLVSLLDSDNFLGRIVVGRVHNGTVRVNMPVKVLSRDGQYKELGRLTKLFSFRGNVRVPIQGSIPPPLLLHTISLRSYSHAFAMGPSSHTLLQAPTSATSSLWPDWSTLVLSRHQPHFPLEHSSSSPSHPALPRLGVADTLTHPDCTTALAALPIDPPTMAVTISVNDSPLAGLDGSKLTSRM